MLNLLKEYIVPAIAVIAVATTMWINLTRDVKDIQVDLSSLLIWRANTQTFMDKQAEINERLLGNHTEYVNELRSLRVDIREWAKKK